jgi:hypothetical protein
MGPNLFHPLNVITQLGIHGLRKDLRVLAGFEIFLPVEEPERNFELAGTLNDGHELFNFIRRQFSRALVDIDLCLLANEIGKPPSNALDLCETKDDIALPLHVGVENAQNVLKLGPLHQGRRPKQERRV